MARLDDRWAGHGETGERFRDRLHPCRWEDLDLFGCICCSSCFEPRAREKANRFWPTGRADLPAAMCSKRVMPQSRSCVLVWISARTWRFWGKKCARRCIRTLWRPGANRLPLSRNGRSAWPQACSRLLRCSASSRGLSGGCGDPALAVVLVNGFFFLRLHKRAEQLASAAGDAVRDLALLSGILARLEQEKFTAPRLAELRRMLDTEGHPPSFRIARLRRLMNMLDSREHVLFRAIDPIVLWTLQWVLAVESWRKRSGPAIRRWLAAVGEMEALSALAGYAYEHPGDPFPDFDDVGPSFHGKGLAHPLLPEDRAVRNNVAIGRELRLVVVSGSNMSGKSTLLRTIGINAVLAQCGAPVRATHLRMSPLAVGASIRIVDSLHEGTSRFYAEITRLKQIVDLTAAPAGAVLFLLDEFLQGTNSHDRRLGAEATVRGLIARGAIRPADHARPRACGDRRQSRRGDADQLPFRRPPGGRQASVRLPAAPGRGAKEQRARTHALAGTRRLSLDLLPSDSPGLFSIEIKPGLTAISVPFSPNYREFPSYNEAATWSEQSAVPCLYCDKELKPFRGFFDEDFCSREHREKYFSSFRKALTGFGGLASQPTAPERPAPSTAVPDPRIADFLPIQILPLVAQAARYGHHPESLSAWSEVEIPSRELAWSVTLDSEERPADLTAACQGTFAILEPAPAPHDSSPSLSAELGSESIALSLETAGPAEPGENDSVPGCYSLWMFDEPMSPGAGSAFDSILCRIRRIARFGAHTRGRVRRTHAVLRGASKRSRAK